MLGRIKFLLTGKLWFVQENCTQDNECSECGSNLFHASGVYMTRQEALDNAKDYVIQATEVIVQEHDETGSFMVFTQSREFWAEGGPIQY